LAGMWADRHGSRALSAGGMLVSAVGLAAMTTLDVHTPYWEGCLWLTIVGIGSGMFNSPNTAAMMGVVPAHRRGIAAGARMMLQNTGAVLSIAFVLAVITNAVPRDTLLSIFSGLASGLSDQRLAPFIHNMHTALWVLAVTSVVGAIVCLMRPAHVTAGAAASATTSGPAAASGSATTSGSATAPASASTSASASAAPDARPAAHRPPAVADRSAA
jgi:MFS family permease